MPQYGAKWSKVEKSGKDTAMLLGTHTPKLDDKGRVILPSRFRDEFASGIVVTRGQDRCLYVFSAKEFSDVHEKIRQAPITSGNGRDYLRVFLSGASDEVPDKQGRVMIPGNLRDYAGLSRELVMIGVGNRAEIWDLSTWNEYLESNEQSFSDISEEVIPGLF